ncbi:MAG: histidinol-phosphatase [Rhizobiaceae bacterium]
MTQPPVDELTKFFHILCDAAEKQTLPRFRTRLAIDNKEAEGFDPVTEGDREAERAIRALIQQHYPDHGIIGEEFGAHNETAELQWVIDPIDGTRSFISGLPLWGTLIGLYQNGIPIAGVMDQPYLGERYLAVDGKANMFYQKGSPTPLATSSINKLSNATLFTTSPHLMQNTTDEAYFNVEQQVELFRYGCDCYAYTMLAAGQIDLVIETGLFIYDIAALIPIIESAGGVVTNWQGESCASGGQILAAANQELHEQAMDVLV